MTGTESFHKGYKLATIEGVLRNLKTVFELVEPESKEEKIVKEIVVLVNDLRQEVNHDTA